MSRLKSSSEEHDVADARRVSAGLDVGETEIVFVPGNPLPLHDVARTEEHHELPEIAGFLIGIVDRHRRDSEHLVAAGAAHGVDAGKAPAVAHGQFRRVGARPQIFRDLDLPRPVDHLVEKRQAGHETHHRHEPGRSGVGGDEVVDRRIAVDPGGELDVGRLRVLMALAKPHERLVGPRVAIVDGDLDDARIERRLGPVRGVLQAPKFLEQIVGTDDVGIELDLERRVCRTDLGDARDAGIPNRVGHGQGLEERLEGHFLADLDENMLVPAETVSRGHDPFSCLFRRAPRRSSSSQALEPAGVNPARSDRLDVRQRQE